MKKQPPSLDEDDDSMDDGKNVAIISYLTALGLLVAFVLNSESRNDFSSFHIKQSLGIFLTMTGVFVLSYIPAVGWIFAGIGLAATCILWMIGLIHAASGNKKTVPFLGDFFNRIFAGI